MCVVEKIANNKNKTCEQNEIKLIRKTSNKYREEIINIIRNNNNEIIIIDDDKETECDNLSIETNDLKPFMFQHTTEEFSNIDTTIANKHKTNMRLIKKGLSKKRGKTQRDYFKQMIECNEESNELALFNIGKSYQYDGKYERAMKYFEKASKKNAESAQTIRHYAYCDIKYSNDGGWMNDKSVKLLIKAWKYSILNKYKSVRQKWHGKNNLTAQLIECAACCLILAQYYKKYHERYNDVTLCWLRRGMNLLEQTKCIILDKVHNNDDIIIESNNNHKIKIKKEKNITIYRKRMNNNIDEYAMTIAEGLLMNYQYCLVDRFGKTDYKIKHVILDSYSACDDQNSDGGENNNNKPIDIDKHGCFAEYKYEKHYKFNNFEQYLRHELDVTFEINYYHFNEDESRYNAAADVCCNYAMFLYDCLSEYNEAEKWNLKALSFRNNDSAICWNLGEIYKQKKMVQKAMEYYEKALQYTSISDNEMQKEFEEIKKEMMSSISPKRLDKIKVENNIPDNIQENKQKHIEPESHKNDMLIDYESDENTDHNMDADTDTDTDTDTDSESDESDSSIAINPNENTNNMQSNNNININSESETEFESDMDEAELGVFAGLDEQQKTKIQMLMDTVHNEYKKQQQHIKNQDIKILKNQIKFIVGEDINNEMVDFIWTFAEENTVNVVDRLQNEGVFFLESMKEMMQQKTIHVENINIACNNEHDDTTESEQESENDSDEEYKLSQNPPIEIANIRRKPPKTNRKKKKKPKKKHKPSQRLLLNDAIKSVETMDGWSPIRKKAFTNRMSKPTEFYYRFNASGISANDKQQIDMFQETKKGQWSTDEHRIFMQNVLDFGVNYEWGLFSKNIPGRVGYIASNRWRKLIQKGWVKDLNYLNNGKKLTFKKASKTCKIPIQYKKFAIEILEDPSEVWANVPMKHPKHPSMSECRRIDKELGYDKCNGNNNNNSNNNSNVIVHKQKKSRTRKRKRKCETDISNESDENEIKPAVKRRKRNNNNKYDEISQESDEYEMFDDVIVGDDNPLPDFIDIMTGDTIIKPAISPFGHVLGYDTWTKILRKRKTKNICPFTKKKMTRRDLVKLTKDNYDGYKNKIVNLTKDNVTDINI